MSERIRQPYATLAQRKASERTALILGFCEGMEPAEVERALRIGRAVLASERGRTDDDQIAQDLMARFLAAADEIELLRELVLDLTRQACERDGELNSMATSTYADAIVYLGSIGQVEIEHQAGRWVIGKVVRHDD